MLDMDIMLFDFLPKILLSIFCGSLIGFERELKDKPAGMRTYMLISTGATMFTMIGVYFAEQWGGSADPLRVAAQIVTGVGFLGAGTIMYARGRISGLTSAAAIWLSAAIGMSIGVGFHIFSVIVVLLAVISMVFLGRIENTLGIKGKKRYKFRVSGTPEIVEQFQDIIYKSPSKFTIIEMDSEAIEEKIVVTGYLSRKEKRNFLKALRKLNCNYKLFDE
ncbi:MAG: MgtC/SapB family protein [Thermoplasmata archaeon]|nr:MgtC/SapB family protein [Thermoplasmata archaeon]